MVGPVDDRVDDILNQLFDIINLSVNDVLIIADAKYHRAWEHIRMSNQMWSILNSWIFWPLTILYAIYVRLPLLMLGHIGRHAILFLQISCRRSSLIRELLLHIHALIKIGIHFLSLYLLIDLNSK